MTLKNEALQGVNVVACFIDPMINHIVILGRCVNRVLPDSSTVTT
jgi:hypothetical protein